MIYIITKLKLKIKNIKRVQKKNEKSKLEKNIQYFEYMEEKIIINFIGNILSVNYI